MNILKILDIVKYLTLKSIPSPLKPDKLRMKLRYFHNYGRFPNIEEPKSYSEKILNRMYYDRNYLYTKLADKYLVREFIKESIGEKYLVPLRYVFDRADELNTMAEWRDSVIKPNHASGMKEIVHEEPSDEKKIEIISKCEKWLKTEYTYFQEYFYKKIPRKLLVERSLCVNGRTPHDYKFDCFPQPDGSLLTALQVVLNRDTGNLTGMFFLNNDFDNCVHFSGPEVDYRIPEENKTKLLEALNLCKTLSKYFNYVRIDWYIAKDNLYFGELTFSPSAGMTITTHGAGLERILSGYWRL